MKIIWSPLAIKKIEDISDYIAHDKPAAAEKWINDVINKVELLEVAPEYGRVVPEIGIGNIREIVFGNYRIIYEITDKNIAILTVRNFKQQLDKLDHLSGSWSAKKGL